MSLLAHRPLAGMDRASVVLPTVKCSSCANEIPLNSLGEHVCAPAPSRPKDNRPAVSSGLAPTALRSKAPSPLRSDFSPLVPPNGLGDYTEPRTPISDDLGRYPDLHSPIVPTMPDTTSGGNAGMAGVGRRAFAAAAWGVRAGVALAAGSGRGFEADQDGPPSPGDSPPMPVPMPYQATGSAGSGGPLKTVTGPNARPLREPSQKERVILPSAPLAERARHERTRSREGAFSRADDYRSASRADSRSASRNDARAGSRADDYRSASRAGPSRSGSRAEEVRAASRAHLERSGSSQSSKSQDNRPFFDKYNAFIGSKSDQTHGSRYSPRGDSDNLSVTSAGEPSSLPWAQSEPDEDDPFQRIEYNHRRYPTDGSIDSTASSHYGPPDGLSSQDEMVMTPSQSWEGLSSVDQSAKGYFDSPKVTKDASLPISLAEIGEEDEEDEGERLVFGAPNPIRANTLPRSSSASTVTPANRSPSLPVREIDPPRIPQSFAPQRSRTEPPLSTSPPTGRPKRVCQKCGQAVGGQRRYVERDGVVLCEADWKKMYLPACRRCKLPIEKSAVSSSDGQLKGKWHRACFTCTRCDSPFEDDDFYVHKGRPWCQYHYAEEAGTLCASASCRKPIEGACILAPSPAGDQRFHPGHLRCDHRGGVSGAQSCRESMAEYYDVAGQRFCERHVGEAVRRVAHGAAPHRAEKRRTKLIDMATGLAAIQPSVQR